MATKDRVLATLKRNEGMYVSGEEMAQTLGISRAAVWKTVTALKEEGIIIEGVRRKGYRIRKDEYILDADEITRHLSRRWNNIRIISYETIDSTNRAAKELAAEGTPHGTVVIADSQTAGRGRLGRTFASPKMTGIYMSIVLQKRFSTDAAGEVTTMAAVAVCKAIEEMTGKRPQIKWVNDLYLNGRKICGILTEASADIESRAVERVVVGIGVNLCTPKSEFPEELRGIAGSVFENEAPTVSREKLAAAIINHVLNSTEKLGTHEHMKAYRGRCMNLGQTVAFEFKGEILEGIAEEIMDDGALAVRLQDGFRMLLKAGEVSIRTPND